eukprot:1141334-Pelagomonas_calceolata.AAC.8
MHTYTLQEPIIADVSKVQRMMEPLLSYHPFWLRLGLLIVTKDAAAAAAAAAADGSAKGTAGGMEAAMRRGLQVRVCTVVTISTQLLASPLHVAGALAHAAQGLPAAGAAPGGYMNSTRSASLVHILHAAGAPRCAAQELPAAGAAAGPYHE